MSIYWKKNIVPLLVEAAFVVSCFVIPSDYFIYTNFIFYFSLLIYFVLIKEFSITEWLKNLKQGKRFWKSVWITVLFFLLSFVLTTVLESSFPYLDTGTIALNRNSWLRLLLFAVSTIILPPVVEETFYRKNLILLGNKITMILTLLFSMFLYAAEHSLSIWGIVLTMIWALPLSISYIKTKNIFVPMTAHFIVNLLGNGTDIIFTVIAWL